MGGAGVYTVIDVEAQTWDKNFKSLDRFQTWAGKELGIKPEAVLKFLVKSASPEVTESGIDFWVTRPSGETWSVSLIGHDMNHEVYAALDSESRGVVNDLLVEYWFAGV